MKRRAYPRPLLDAREKALIEALNKEFKAFTKPGPLKRSLRKLTDATGDFVPGYLKKKYTKTVSSVANWRLIDKTLEVAEGGFHILTQQAARMTVSKETVVKRLSSAGTSVGQFEEICLLRSYQIESVIEEKTYQDKFLALIEGGATGSVGLPGVPFSLALSFFLYFRASQSIALHYGYDVKHDPRELQFAAEVTMQSLDPNFAGNGLGGLIGKMMLTAHLSGLRQSLGRLTYAEMAKRGGSELLFVQIRALANKAAEKALASAGREGIEFGVYKTLLVQLARRIPKESAKKAIPMLGALIGGLSDAYFMSRVLRGAKLIYHKRYLFEKGHRVALLRRVRGRHTAINGNRGGSTMRHA